MNWGQSEDCKWGWGTATGPRRQQPGALLSQAHTCRAGGSEEARPARSRLPRPGARRPLPGAAPIGCGDSSDPPHAIGGGRRGPERAAPLPPPPPPAPPLPGAPRASGSAPHQLPVRLPPGPRPRRGRQPRRGAPAWPRAAATTPRAVLRVKNGAAKLPKPPAAAAAAEAPGAGAGMERSQSRLSLSASFEALAIYFPCMNSFDDEDAGKRAHRPRPLGAVRGASSGGPFPDPVRL